MAPKATVLVLSGDDLAQFEAGEKAAKAVARKAYLAKGYIPCVLQGCEGLVAPRYIRTREVNGKQVRFGYCPRTEAHARIRAEAQG